MSKVLIFAGTTEGRELSLLLSDNQIPCEVCVATEYGEAVMPQVPGIEVHRGRMDTEQMKALMKQKGYQVIVDATHPFAVQVSENIRQAAAFCDIPCLRLKRETGEKNGVGEGREQEDKEPEGQESWENAATGSKGAVHYMPDAKACADYLAQTGGNILLTTGSKELSVYCTREGLKERLYVRVLPGLESISLCEKNGLKGRQMIAMQGPFCEEMNRALIRQYDIRFLVTKESGKTGGFPEKLAAAKKERITTLVIGNPEKEDTEGMALSQVCRQIAAITGQSIRNKVSFVGMGMGQKKGLTEEAIGCIGEADYLFGAPRLLQAVRAMGMGNEAKSYPYYLMEQIEPVLEQIKNTGVKIAILFSGDTGFYSGCEKLYQALEKRGDSQLHICPGISSVACLAAITGISYQDAVICSIHGHGKEGTWEAAFLGKIKQAKKAFVLLSGRQDVQILGSLLQRYGMAQCRVILGYQLCYPGQRVWELTPEECCRVYGEGLYLCLLRNETPQRITLTPGMPDSSFLRDKVPMTKEEIRALSLCKLRLTPGAVCYDIGSGSGSVAVEMAQRAGDIMVYAIEYKELALELIKRNVARFQLPNVWVIAGKAPECLEELPAPTHAFIGGSSGKLTEILEELHRRNPKMRVVINAVSLETIAQLAALKELPYLTNLEMIQVQVTRVKELGSYQMMQSENPVMICSFDFQ